VNPLTPNKPSISDSSTTSGVSRPTRRLWASRHALLLLVAFAVVSVSVLDGAPREALAQERPLASSASLDAQTEGGATAHLPVVSETLQLRIDDGFASTMFRHVFQNETKARLEGTYRLMVGEGATATGFAYWNGEEKIVGEVFEREAAREIYEALSGMRRDPGLLEQTGEGSFSFRVFPIEPAEKKRVEVTTGRMLQHRRGKIEYRARLSRTDAAFDVEIRDGRGVTALESSTHTITSEPLPGGGTRVRVGAPKDPKAEAPELVLSYANENVEALHATLHKGDGAGYFSVALGTKPAPASEKRAPHDVTLVLDRSGSMSGEPMEAAKAAAKKVIDQLEPTDAVNVIAFDDKVETLFDRPHVLDADTRAKADRFLTKIDARGGTEIGKALEHALASQTKDARPDVVFFLTDGQSDGPSAIKIASADTSATSVFTVGLGSGVDKALLAKIASLRHGRFTFVADARAVGAELPKLLAQLSPAVLTDLRLSADGAKLDAVYPSTLPDLFHDDELRVSGRVEGSKAAKIIVEAKERGVPKRFEVAIDPATGITRPWVARTWALSRVSDLLEQEKGNTNDTERAHMHDEVVDLGLTWELVTPYTSFLALPEKEITKEVSGSVTSMRERRAKLLAANKDAATLSRSAMPPGDPILKVRAPKDARRVTAWFPFGLTLDLLWDDGSEQWLGRFLVPKEVVDGTYEVPVSIVHADGRVEASAASYTIDAKEPSFEVLTEARPGGVFVRVLVDEPALEVRLGLPGAAAVSLAPAVDKLSFTGFVPARFVVPEGGLAPGAQSIRVVVADRARNESDRVVRVGL
jgi:Ca-activated chloride channel family protein